MMSALWQTLLAVVVVSSISFVGVLTLSFKKFFRQYLFVIVSFAAGTLIGTAFLEMIPESIEHAGSSDILLYVILGIITFYLLETGLSWYHCHHHSCGHPHQHPREYTYLNLFGDGIHNFLDGAIIAVSFLAGTELGITATIAVILHEIPQEIGDFAILIRGGLSNARALFFNFLSALTAVLGALAGYFFLQSFEFLEPHLLALGAGGFIYIATVDLLPELNNESRSRVSLIQAVFFVIGALVVYVIGFIPLAHP